MVLLALFTGCSTSTPPAQYPKGLQPLRIAQLVDELESPRDRTRVYNFWATWCRPCLAEMPILKTFGEQHPEVDLVFVNVDLPHLHGSRVKATIRRMHLDDFGHIGLDDMDPAGAIHAVGNWPDSIPVTLVVDARGRRVKQFNTSVRPAMLERAIAELR